MGWIVDRKTISGKKNYQFGRNFFHVPGEPRENPYRQAQKKPPEGGGWGAVMASVDRVDRHFFHPIDSHAFSDRFSIYNRGMEQIKESLDEAIHKAGGLSQFVRAIRAPSTHAVKSWKRLNSIPADYCPTIERATGVACERLRPSVDWGVLRGTTPKEAAWDDCQALQGNQGNLGGDA